MEAISVLDCTLRDGGYCNQWMFGEANIKTISANLVEAGIDIIELGFLSNKISYNKDVSKYTTVEEASAMIPVKHQNMFVCMINYGEFELSNLPKYEEGSLDGIRVAFHKKDMPDALRYCEEIHKKGYKVFVQPMVTLSYSDEEFLELISKVNEFLPYAFYIVDSFGVMKRKDLIRLFYMVEHNLSEDIRIGYHSHNNMQLAYSNAQSLVDIRTKRHIIFDSTIFGMGRGAGNLNTELFVEYVNDNIANKYQLKPLLTVIDEILNGFYQQSYWGYSLPNYLSAKHNVHPNYASYLDTKKTLTVEDMDEIFSSMNDIKKVNFDKVYIEELYIKYMAKNEANENHLTELKDKLKNKNVLIIAPGHSSIDEKEKIIKKAAEKDVIVISVNFEYKECISDYIFLSNLRRYKNLEQNSKKKSIVTSNIPSVEVYVQTKYVDLLNEYDGIKDNSAMMLIKFLIRLGTKKIYLAGLDGYSMDYQNNYAYPEMTLYTKSASQAQKNENMQRILREYAKEVEIEFITKPRYVNIR